MDEKNRHGIGIHLAIANGAEKLIACKKYGRSTAPVILKTINHKGGKDMKQEKNGFWDDAKVIHSYTADEGEADGMLINVSGMAYRVGFNPKYQIRITAGIADVLDDGARSESGDIVNFFDHLRELLVVARYAIAKTDNPYLAEFEFMNFSTREAQKIWAGLDMTSGPAVHIFLPSEY